VFDLSAAVAYRGLALNDAARNAAAGPIIGNLIEDIGWSGVSGVGMSEKRARGDGRDTGDVYLDGRRFPIRGTTYGATRGDAWDRFLALCGTLAPTNAYNASLDTFGYLPLSGSIPTDRTDDFPSGTIPLFINVRPLATPSIDDNRDRTGGVDAKGFGIPWTINMEARDPRVYVDSVVEVVLSGTSGSGTLDNDGTYPTPVTIIIVASAAAAQSFRFVGLGADLTLTVPILAASGSYAITFDGNTRVVTRTYLGDDSVQEGYITYTSEQMYPEVPPDGDTYAWTASASLAAGSMIRYYPAFI
jgi:hypothetical protein